VIIFISFEPQKVKSMKFLVHLGVMLLVGVVLSACVDKQTEESNASADSLALDYSIVSTLPHNAEAYTQGLIIYNNKVLESTGQKGASWIAEVNPGSGQHEKKITLDSRYFGEGITVLNDKLYQLTWEEKTGFIYDAQTYKKLGEFKYNTPGWGLTHDNKNLIMSDGTDKLYFLDTTNLKVIRTLTVTDPGGARVKNLNELEYVNGYVFANVYETAMILKIDPDSGKVVGRLDLSAVANEIKRMYPNTDVLNGIAYDKNSKALLVTGKLWPKSYLIRVN
jgi:glutaminyl-peptide cyclotransferase